MTAPGPLRSLVIVGAGGQGREMLDTIEALNRLDPMWEFVGFLADDDTSSELVAARGSTILGPVARLEEVDAVYLIGIGDPAVRRRVDALAGELGREPATVVHPSAELGSEVVLGPGTYVGPNAVLTTNVTIGRHTIVNVGVTLSHDVTVGDFVTIGPGSHLAGNVVVEDDADLGVGVVARPGARIGAGTIVGAGAVVVGDLAAGIVAVGVPAVPLG